MTNEQLDDLQNLVQTLCGRIDELEREVSDLHYRVNNTEVTVDRLEWNSYNER